MSTLSEIARFTFYTNVTKNFLIRIYRFRILLRGWSEKSYFTKTFSEKLINYANDPTFLGVFIAFHRHFFMTNKNLSKKTFYNVILLKITQTKKISEKYGSRQKRIISATAEFPKLIFSDSLFN